MTNIAVTSLPMGEVRGEGACSAVPWRYRRMVGKVRAEETALGWLEAGGIRERMEEVRGRLREAGVEGAEKILDQEMARVFGAACVTARRELGMRPYDVQVVGGYELHRGRVAEMATGEGKTLAATMPAALHAMTGRGVHVVTVNDYLAQRDAQLMAPIYLGLGLSVGVILAGMPDAERRRAYACDVVYGTNKEFGFDYLRDQIKLCKRRERGGEGTIDVLTVLGMEGDGEPVMRGLYFAVVDEADSVLIDESRTPLVVAEGAGRSGRAWAYEWAEKVSGRLRAEQDFLCEVAKGKVEWTEIGLGRLQKFLAETNTPGLMGGGGGESWQGLVLNALKARHLYMRERQYVVANGEVVLVDEFTGRRMEGRTWAEGIQQAIQAKEKLPVTMVAKTLARTTYQHYFSLYEKLSGMTGTAMASRGEFGKVYGLKAVVVPTHRRVRREILSDVVVRTKREKWAAVAGEIERVRAEGARPVLVGTGSIEDSEALAAVLVKRGIGHEVLNARVENAFREAEIVERAGEAGAVTIATNMAGRGTDIRLSAEAQRAGGLYVIGTQLHESRRIDRQLVGRCGRQGDPGSARFFLSLQDGILGHLLGRAELVRLRRRFGGKWGEVIGAAGVRALFAKAQRKVELLHWRQRRQLMEYEEWLSKIYYQMGSG